MNAPPAPGMDPARLFALFNDIGIIQQLVRTLLEARLPDGLIDPHFAVLNHLSRRPQGNTAQVMARAFQVPKTSLSHTLKGLEARGLVATVPNPGDARSKIVTITAEGRALRDRVVAAMTADFAALPQAIGPERLAQAAPILADLRAWLDAERNARDGF